MKKAMYIIDVILVIAAVVLQALNIAGIVEKLWWAQICICAAMLIQIRLRREEKR